jgi:thiol-disulfide isomerase/thioredoxin
MRLKIGFIFCVSLLIFTAGCSDCDGDKDAEIIPIVGKMSWAEWQESAGWDDYSAKSYKLSDKMVKKLRSVIAGYDNLNFICVSANWCIDSERGVPRIYKLLAEAGYDVDRIELYGVDRQKSEPSGDVANYGIEKVPTLIILDGDVEIGRIVESPIVGWSEDMLTILGD